MIGIMKRLAAAATMLLLLSIPGQPARADSAALGWDSDRVISSIVVINENDTLTIGPGVNLSFEPDTSGAPAENDTRPILAVMGRLVVNGTRGEPVGFRANESLRLTGNEPDCLYIFSPGRPDIFSVRNASFSNLIINIDGAGGVFRDCVFERCDVLVAFSAASFINCTFIGSAIGTSEFPGEVVWPSAVTVRGCRFDGRDQNDSYLRTAIDLQRGAAIEDCTIAHYNTAIVLDMNSSSVRNCEIRDCRDGITLDGNFRTDTAEIFNVSVQNCTGTGISAWGRLTLADSVIGDCGYAGVASYGDLLMANCTVYGCPTGVNLWAWFDDPPPDWLLSGNRFFGCTEYALVALGQEVEIAGNRFDNGSVSNGEGWLKVSTAVRVRVVDPLDFPVSGECDLSWTDNSGLIGGGSFISGSSVILEEYTIGNDGVRVDRFPYTLSVRKGTITNRTVLPDGESDLSMVLDILADLVPVQLWMDNDGIRAGQEIRFIVRVNNNGGGTARESTVSFVVDGRVVDRQEVPRMSVRGASSVYSAPWVATPGRHALEALVDSSGYIRENNETNNNISVQFNVSGADSAGSSGRYLGSNPAFISLVVAVIIIYVLLMLYIRRRRRRRIERGMEPTPAGDLEPTPATIYGAARIRCPKCGKVNEVASPVRPLEVDCELCRSRFKLVK